MGISIDKKAANALARRALGTYRTNASTRAAAKKLYDMLMNYRSNMGLLPVVFRPAEISAGRRGDSTKADIRRIYRSYEDIEEPRGLAKVRITPDMIPMSKYTGMLNEIVDNIHNGKRVDKSIYDVVRLIAGADVTRRLFRKTLLIDPTWARKSIHAMALPDDSEFAQNTTWGRTNPYFRLHQLHFGPLLNTRRTAAFYPGMTAPSRIHKLPFMYGGFGLRGLAAFHEMTHVLADNRRTTDTINKHVKRKNNIENIINSSIPYSVKPSLVDRMSIQLGILLAAMQKYIRLNPQLYTQFRNKTMNKLLLIPVFARSGKYNNATGLPVSLYNLHKLVRHNPELYGLFSHLGLRNLQMLRNIALSRFIPRSNLGFARGLYDWPLYKSIHRNNSDYLTDWRLHVRHKPDDLLVIARVLPKAEYGLLFDLW